MTAEAAANYDQNTLRSRRIHSSDSDAEVQDVNKHQFMTHVSSLNYDRWLILGLEALSH